MEYKYAKEHLDYSDYASGRVFHSLPGHPAFPIRLASEIFQRCLARRAALYNKSDPCVLYDPCCGAAYHLSVLAYLHGTQIREVIASDVDEKVVALAKRNLDLLNIDGLNRRIDDISKMFERYGKSSHEEALHSANILKTKLVVRSPLITRVFHANVIDGQTILKNVGPKSVDIVFTDVPYGQHSRWHNSDGAEMSNPLWSMLESLHGILSSWSIVAIVSDKQQKAAHENYQRVEQFQVGKRRVLILKPAWN
jgi:tRNA G10  N-methylase Trm11